jgi:hypothetical protein
MGARSHLAKGGTPEISTCKISLGGTPGHSQMKGDSSSPQKGSPSMQPFFSMLRLRRHGRRRPLAQLRGHHVRCLDADGGKPPFLVACPCATALFVIKITGETTQHWQSRAVLASCVAVFGCTGAGLLAAAATAVRRDIPIGTCHAWHIAITETSLTAPIRHHHAKCRHKRTVRTGTVAHTAGSATRVNVCLGQRHGCFL